MIIRYIMFYVSMLSLALGSIPATADDAQLQYTGETISVMNLNLAHGRKSSLNQMLVTKKRTIENLRDIADVIKRTNVDITAFQEADGVSLWSGKFDHVAFLADASSMSASVHTNHAHNWLYNYGTALISRFPFINEVHHTFKPTPPTTNKGFSLGQIMWQYGAAEKDVVRLDVVSVHLDFSRKSVREQQIAEMVSVLEPRKNPIIIMGDFNSDWLGKEKVVQELADKTRLHAYQPDSNKLGTFLSSGRRLDWILISNDLEFISYQTLPDVLSDHLAVIAKISRRHEKATSAQASRY